MKLTVKVLAGSGTQIWNDYFTDYEGPIPQIGHTISYKDSLDSTHKAVIKNVEWVFSFDGIDEVNIICSE